MDLNLNPVNLIYHLWIFFLWEQS